MAYYFKCNLNKPPLSFRCGETIRFEVHAFDRGRETDCQYIRWQLKTDDGQNLSGLHKYKTGEPFVIETSLSRPGFAYLICKAYNSNNEVVSGFEVLEAGAGAEVEKIEYHDTLPDDFYDYWADLEKIVADTTLEVLLYKEIPNATDGFKAYDVRIKTPFGRPSAFTLTMPDKEGKFPIKLNFMGYGIVATPISYTDDTITAHFNAHGVETLMPRIEIMESNPDIADGYGFDDNDNSDKMITYYRGMMIRNLIGVKYLKTLENWDRENLISTGGSQGALQATTVAAHDNAVTFLDIEVPWFCDLKARSEGYLSGWRPNFKEGLRYFDTVSQGMLVKCPVRIFAGLGDYICPPSSIMSLYNSIKTLKTIKFRQAKTHSYDPNELDDYSLNFDPDDTSLEFKKGKYRHFKGNEYDVIDIGLDCETMEEMVIYKALYGDNKVWIRPLGEFRDFVYRDNKVMKRFKLIEENE